jgi:hypothetical protein
MADTDEIAVLYLLRNGNDPLLFKAFLASLCQNRTAVDYVPIVIQKGFPDQGEHPLVASWQTAQGRRATVYHVADDGFDLTAYRKVAEQISATHCLFFNSYCRILGPNWLETYVHAANELGPGSVIGATGSWRSSDDQIAFPSPHLRTNAIFLRRELYLSFGNRFATKDDCIHFESGAGNLSQAVMEAGSQVAIACRSGHYALPADWPTARTYYSGDQEELLVTDNRTHNYQITRAKSRGRLARAAFGDSAMIVKASWLRRKISALRWALGKAVA